MRELQSKTCQCFQPKSKISKPILRKSLRIDLLLINQQRCPDCQQDLQGFSKGRKESHLMLLLIILQSGHLTRSKLGNQQQLQELPQPTCLHLLPQLGREFIKQLLLVMALLFIVEL
jgi:hypothetical protein